MEELEKVDPLATDDNAPTTLTGTRLPKDLLVEAREALGSEVDTLEASYHQAHAAVEPIQILEARYTLKRWLGERKSLPFTVMPETVDFDHAPLPAYEANQLDDRARRRFEHWMLTSPEVCQDIAEWAPFAMALRGGLPARPPAPEPQPQPQTERPARPADDSPPWALGVILAILVGGGLLGLFLWLNG